MNYLLDTHIFLWLIKRSSKIPNIQFKILQDLSNDIYISNVSFLEIALKYQTGKLDLLNFAPKNLPEIAKEFNIRILDIDAQTMADSYQLSTVKKHKDPFDRLLIWFCLQNKWTLLSVDNKLNEYTKLGLKWI